MKIEENPICTGRDTLYREKHSAIIGKLPQQPKREIISDCIYSSNFEKGFLVPTLLSLRQRIIYRVQHNLSFENEHIVGSLL